MMEDEQSLVLRAHRTLQVSRDLGKAKHELVLAGVESARAEALVNAMHGKLRRRMRRDGLITIALCGSGLAVFLGIFCITGRILVLYPLGLMIGLGWGLKMLMLPTRYRSAGAIVQQRQDGERESHFQASLRQVNRER